MQSIKMRQTPNRTIFQTFSKITSALAILCLVLMASHAPIGHAAFPGTNGKIAFDRNRQIWTMNPDGSDQTSLNSTGDSPAWSPDGRKIAFNDDQRTGIPRIYVMNANGSNQIQLTNGFIDTRPVTRSISTEI